MGTLDGTLIVVEQRPALTAEDYFSRKKLSGLAALVICDNSRKISHAYTGFAESKHDARVYSYCDVDRNPDAFFDGPEYIL